VQGYDAERRSVTLPGLGATIRLGEGEEGEHRRDEGGSRRGGEHEHDDD
jgi:hypothetical protein